MVEIILVELKGPIVANHVLTTTIRPTVTMIYHITGERK